MDLSPVFHSRCASRDSTTLSSLLSSFYCAINLWFLGCFACFSPQHVASQIVCERRSFISPCMDWQTYQRWGGIISAVAEGCREVVWHRHWLSLLRSEGIVRLRKKRERKGAKWVSKWTILQIGLDEMQVSCGCALFIYFIFVPHLVQVEPAISHAFLTPDRQEMVVEGGISRSQIAKRRQELDNTPHCLLPGLLFDSWSLWRGGGGPESAMPAVTRWWI